MAKLIVMTHPFGAILACDNELNKDGKVFRLFKIPDSRSPAFVYHGYPLCDISRDNCVINWRTEFRSKTNPEVDCSSYDALTGIYNLMYNMHPSENRIAQVLEEAIPGSKIATLSISGSHPTSNGNNSLERRYDAHSVFFRDTAGESIDDSELYNNMPSMNDARKYSAHFIIFNDNLDSLSMKSGNFDVDIRGALDYKCFTQIIKEQFAWIDFEPYQVAIAVEGSCGIYLCQEVMSNE